MWEGPFAVEAHVFNTFLHLPSTNFGKHLKNFGLFLAVLSVTHEFIPANKLALLYFLPLV